MITKERLEELINKCATIYMARAYTEGVYLMPENFEVNEKELIFKYKIYAVPLEDLFETEEEAKWFAEFGCIERTERLELPTWEEFKNKKTKHVCFMGKDTFCFFELYEDKQKNRLILLDHDCDYEYFNEELTKENYTTACGLCKEFFLGEKK